MSLYPRHQKVGMSEWAKGDGDTVLDTQGLFSCTGVAVYDETSKTGHMMHSTGPTVQRWLVEPFFESVQNATDDPLRLKVWVRGNAVSDGMPEYEVEESHEERAYIWQSILELGVPLSRRDIRWGDSGVDMLLDCRTGRFMEGEYISQHHPTSQPLGIRYLASLRKGEPFVDGIQDRAIHLRRVLESFLTDK